MKYTGWNNTHVKKGKWYNLKRVRYGYNLLADNGYIFIIDILKTKHGAITNFIYWKYEQAELVSCGNSGIQLHKI